MTSATIVALVPLLGLAACKATPDERHHMPQANAERGRLAMERAGCGACHAIPGVWPQGVVGPRLAGFAEQNLIGGSLPNRPDVLAGFVRNAPLWLPEAGMPAMPLSEEEARDVAAYLYTLKGH